MGQAIAVDPTSINGSFFLVYQLSAFRISELFVAYLSVLSMSLYPVSCIFPHILSQQLFCAKTSFFHPTSTEAVVVEYQLAISNFFDKWLLFFIATNVRL